MSGLTRLFKFVKPYKAKFIVSMILTVIKVLSRTSQPFLIGLAISEIATNLIEIGIGGINFKYIAIIIALIIITGLIDAVTEYSSYYFLYDVIQDSMRDIRRDINSKLNKLPVSYFDKQLQGELLSRITTDVDVVSNALQQGAFQVVNGILTLIFSVAFMFYISPFFTLIAVLMYPITFYFFNKFLKKTQSLFRVLQNTLGELNGHTQEYFNGHEVVQLYNGQELVTKQFETINGDMRSIGFKSNFISSTINPILSFITNMFYILLFIFLALTVLRGNFVVGGVVLAAQLKIGQVQSFIQYIWQAGGPIRDISQQSTLLQSGMAALSRIFDILDEKEDKNVKSKVKVEKDDIEGNVGFDNISFGYSKRKLLMKSIDVDIKSGEMIAIVGPTGAGKTTLINLLMRFYELNSGKITIDGNDIAKMSKHRSRSFFSMVPQDPWLYNATIAENIRFGKLDASMEEIEEAARIANVDHYIRTLPDGYDAVVNQESTNISQGQKQLVTIARAIISDPSILILDEATSSVDTRLEQLIQDAMAKAMKGRTSFVIAHRLSTIRNADLILVMSSGNIVEQGTHKSLLEVDGLYKNLYESQFLTKELF